MTIKKNLFLILFSLISYMVSYSQQLSCSLVVTGSITLSDSSNTDLSSVSVYIKQINHQIHVENNGDFIVRNLCSGRFEIRISYVGYKSIDTTLTIKDNTAFGFVLINQTQLLTGVTVTSRILKKNELTVEVKDTLGGLAMEETRGLSLGESLKNIAGVNSLQSGPNISKPVIHGVYSNRILIVNNGVRQEGQTWGNDHAPEIDPFIATKFSVIKGPASIRYGSDAIGGVVLVDPADMPRIPGVDGNVNLVAMTNGRVGVGSAMIEQAFGDKLEGLSWRLQGTLRKAGNAQAADYYLGNTGFNEDDYSATLQYNKAHYGVQLYYSMFNTRIGIATASVVGSIEDLNAAFTRSQPIDTASFTYNIVRPYQTVNHQLFKTSGYIDLSKNLGRIEGTYAFQRDVRKEYDADVSFNDSLNANNIPDLNFQLNTQTVDLAWEHPAIKNKIAGSIGFNFITHSNIEQGTSYQQLIPNFLDYGGGVYAIEKLQTRKWIFEGGLRYDYRWLQAYALDPTNPTIENKPIYNWQNATVNLGAEYKFSDHFSALYNFGTAWRPPQVIELFANGIHQSAASFEIGDSSLTLEKAYNNNLSFIFNGEKISFEAGFYVNYFHHYIYLKPDSLPVQTIQGAFPAFTYTQVNALFEGIDLNITYDITKHLRLVSKTSIVRARNETTNEWLVYIPADRYDNSIRYHWDSTGRWKSFFIGVGNLAVSRQIRVPPNSDYVAPPPGYDLSGMEAGFSIPFYKKYIDINLTVANLTNVSYRDYLNRFRYYINDLGRNFSLRLMVPF
jgi:iron complex outermembrane recepter protein